MFADEVTPQPEPFESTSLDKALTELNKPEPTPEPAAPAAAAPPVAEPPKAGAEPPKPGEPKPGESPAAAAPKPGEAVTPTGPFKVGEEAKFKISDVAVKTKEEIENLPYANDATFKGIMAEFEQLAQFKIGMAEALNDGAYKIPDAETMKAVVADAFSLYDIINLKESPAGLFDLAAKNYGQDQVNQVIASILLYAKEKGITEAMYSDLSKPENKKIFDLARESRERKQNEERDRATRELAKNKEATDKIVNATSEHIGKLFDDLKIDEADRMDYTTILLAQIEADPKLREQVQQGKYAEVDRIVTEFNNRIVERQKRWEAALTERKGKREETLKGSAAPAGGGTPPKEAPRKKVDITDDDARMDAVRAALRE